MLDEAADAHTPAPRQLVPLRQFVLKMHSRCDLACDHCYVYEHADTSWRGRPRRAGETVVRRTAERIAEHALAHRLTRVHIVLHGGEPLLAGKTGLREAAQELHRALDGVCALDLRIHTNGVLLDEEFLELFAEFDIKVGISLDGDRAANDRHRRYADGRTSHPQVLRAVALLDTERHRHLFAGLLCTIDVRNDPIAVYDALLALRPPHIDFLLPHATWDNPPLRPDGPGTTPYADWLLAIHQRWTEQGRPVPIRTFDSVHRTLRGGSSLTESLGLEPANLVVVETDGTLEQADSLKTAYDGAPATGLDVFTHSFDIAAEHPGVTARQHGLDGLAEKCRRCPVVRSCGGGLYAHRYRSGSASERESGSGSDFENPSVFCGDLLSLIGGIRDIEDGAREAVKADASALPAGLTESQMDELAAGFGGADAVNALTRAQLGIDRSLLAAVAATAGRDGAAWSVLSRLDAEAPEAVNRVVTHPYARPWAVSCLSKGGAGDPADLAGGRAGDLAGDLAGGLAEIAAAAMLRAGTGGPVEVPIREGGVLRLPTLGRVLLPAGLSAELSADKHTAQLDAEADGMCVVRFGSSDGTTRPAAALRFSLDEPSHPNWQPVRQVHLPSCWTLALEDTDPLRDSHQWPVTDRLDGAALQLWTDSLTEAWELIGRELPAYGPGLAAGLRTVTPLRPAAGRDVSAAARLAFGTVGVALPASPDLLALLLIHEFQHVKLGAVLDVGDLFDRTDTTLYYAPWRDDPRPLEGLLQGTYAHIAVADFWRTQRGRELTAEAAADAEAKFVRWRTQTAEAAETLLDSGSLTPLGERFARGMRTTLSAWSAERVSAAAARAGRESAERHHGAWQARA